MDCIEANGSSSKPKNTSSSELTPLQRPTLVSSPITSPHLPHFKKSKKTSPTKISRSRTYDKGFSLPKVASIAVASENFTEQGDSGEELEVLKCILVREGYLQRLGRASAVGHVGGIHLDNTLHVLDLLRAATLDTVEAIVGWRDAKEKRKRTETGQSVAEPEQYKWNGINYLLKLASDLDFLAKHTGLTEGLGFTVHRNPFISPLNLDSQVPRNVQCHDLIENEETQGSHDNGKRSQSSLGNLCNDASVNNAKAVKFPLLKKKFAKTPYETRVVNDEDLISRSPSKIHTVSVKSRALQEVGTLKCRSKAPFLMSEVDTARVVKAGLVVVQEEAVFGRYTRDIHNRVVPEDEARRRWNMVEMSGNAYNVPATLQSSYSAEDSEGNDLRLERSTILNKNHAKKRSGMLGPISKPNWRAFNRLPLPRRRARGAQFEQDLAAEKEANVQLHLRLNSLREETERKAMDVAYFESCTNLQGFAQELQAFTRQAQRELQLLRSEVEEKEGLCVKKHVNIQKKQELIFTFKEQHKALQDAMHAKRIKGTLFDFNQDQLQWRGQRQSEGETAVAAEQQKHDQAKPLVLHFCATQIQKVVRGMLTRATYESTKIELTVASTFIQAGVRGFLVRRYVAKLYWCKVASIHIQRIARGWLARLIVKRMRTRRHQQRSAVRIQKRVRGRFGRIRMAKIRELMASRLQLALASRSIEADTLQELASACQSMVTLPFLVTMDAKTHAKPLPALLLGLVRLLMLFTSDSDDEWDVPRTRWHEAACFLRCSVSLARRMQNVADAAAGAARACLLPSGKVAAAGVATSMPYLRESPVGSALLDACMKDSNFQVETFELLPRGWRAAVAIFHWTTAFHAIVRLQHLVERSTMSTDPYLVISRTLSKREAEQELAERLEVEVSDKLLARRFVPIELTRARDYPFHRPRPLLLVVATDVPLKARHYVLEKLQVALPGLFFTISRPLASSKRDLNVQNSASMFDFTAIRNAYALGQCVMLDGDVGLRDVTQRAFCSSFASIKYGLQPLPMCILLRGKHTNRSDLFVVKQGNDSEKGGHLEETRRRMVDADIKAALDRTTRLRLELASDTVTREMIEQAKYGLGDVAPSPAIVTVMEAVIVLLTPLNSFASPFQREFATSSVSWCISRQLLAHPAPFRAKLKQVDVTTLSSTTLVALEQYLCHALWPNAVVVRSQVHCTHLLYGLASWVESAVQTAQLIAADGAGSLAPEITRSHPISGLFERVIVFNNSPTDQVVSGAGEDLAVMEVLDAVLADVQVYRTAHHLVHSCTSARKRTKVDQRDCCVVTLFHKCRRLFASAYAPRTSQRWMTVISENDIDNLLMPTEGEETFPPTSHAEMYTRLARLCMLQRRRSGTSPESMQVSTSYELTLRPQAKRLYRHVVPFGGYPTTVTIAKLSCRHVKVDVYVHGSSVKTRSTQSVTLTLSVDLETIQGRLSAAQARHTIGPTARISSMMLDRIRLYCITRTPMVVSNFQQQPESLVRLRVQTCEKSPGRVLLRRAIRQPANRLGERWIFTLLQRHEDGEFQAVFYAPQSSARHIVQVSNNAAKELLRLSKHAPSSQLQQVLLRTFCLAKPSLKKENGCIGDSDSGGHLEDDRLIQDSQCCYRLRQRILCRFSCSLRFHENIQQEKHVVRMYVQVELCDEEDRGDEQAIRETSAIRYRLWLPESCREQYLVLHESEIEVSLPVEQSWNGPTVKARRTICQDIVHRFFEWDSSIGNGCVVASLPCGVFKATERTTHDTKKLSGWVSRQQRVKPRALQNEVGVISCTRMLDSQYRDSDDEDDNSKARLKRNVFCYDLEELVHKGSYRVNGMYVVVRVSMRAVVLLGVPSTFMLRMDRGWERDSFTITFRVHDPVSSQQGVACINGYRDLREVVGPDKPTLISSTTLDKLLRHIIMTRSDVQVYGKASDDGTALKVTFLRDRLYAKQQATVMTRMVECASNLNAIKLIDESRRHGSSRQCGMKVLTTAKDLPGYGRTLFTVFDVAASHKCVVMLRVDAYICATSVKMSLIVEGCDLTYVVGEENQELLQPMTHNDTDTLEIVEMEKNRRRKLARILIDYVKINPSSDACDNRLVLSECFPFHCDILSRGMKVVKLFTTIRAVGHDQVLLSAYFDKSNEDDAASSLRLELYDPLTDSRCTLLLLHSKASAILGFPDVCKLDQMALKESIRAVLMTHLCSLLHIEPANPDQIVEGSCKYTMNLQFDERRAMKCMEQHINNNTSGANPEVCSWTGITTSTDEKYISLHLQLLLKSTSEHASWLMCSAFAPAEMLVNARTIELAELPTDVLNLLPDPTKTADQAEMARFFAELCEKLHLEIQYNDEDFIDATESKKSRQAKFIDITLG